MPEVIAIHTIHRPGKAKGQQEIVKPGEEFECSGKEYDGLKKRGAIKDKPGEKKADTETGKQTRKTGGKTAAGKQTPAKDTGSSGKTEGDGDDAGLGDL